MVISDFQFFILDSKLVTVQRILRELIENLSILYIGFPMVVIDASTFLRGIVFQFFILDSTGSPHIGHLSLDPSFLSILYIGFPLWPGIP